MTLAACVAVAVNIPIFLVSDVEVADIGVCKNKKKIAPTATNNADNQKGAFFGKYRYHSSLAAYSQLLLWWSEDAKKMLIVGCIYPAAAMIS